MKSTNAVEGQACLPLIRSLVPVVSPFAWLFAHLGIHTLRGVFFIFSSMDTHDWRWAELVFPWCDGRALLSLRA